MMINVTTEPGFINFEVENKQIINEIKNNTYIHCDFVKLWLGNAYTTIEYICGGKLDG